MNESMKLKKEMVISNYIVTKMYQISKKKNRLRNGGMVTNEELKELRNEIVIILSRVPRDQTFMILFSERNLNQVVHK
jgi:hypothetical protein